MKVILNIDYNRYAMSVEDAAKIMAMLGKAQSVSSRYDNDAGQSYWQYDKDQPRVSIEQAPEEIRPASA